MKKRKVTTSGVGYPKSTKRIVMKFGGSSNSDEKLKIIARYILEFQKKGHEVIVVLSARGKTTNELIATARQFSEEPNLKALDLLLSTGETQAVALLAIALKALGAEVSTYDAFRMKMITTTVHGAANIIDIKAVGAMERDLRENKIVVCAGFQGVVRKEDGSWEITTLGRGGSDTSAVALAYVLKANLCQIYTDVDGVYAVDPRLVPKARHFAQLPYSYMFKLAEAGAGVLHDRCVSLACDKGIPLEVLLSPSLGEGRRSTLIRPGSGRQTIEHTAITDVALAIQKVATINIANIPNRPGAAREIFLILYRAGLQKCRILQAEPAKTASMSLIVSDDDLEKFLGVSRKSTSVEKMLADLFGRATENILRQSKISIRKQRAIITLVHISGVNNLLFDIVFADVLRKLKINIDLFQDSATGSMMAVINRRSIRRTARVLAQHFKLTTD